jgi:hypothetical protein
MMQCSHALQRFVPATPEIFLARLVCSILAPAAPDAEPFLSSGRESPFGCSHNREFPDPLAQAGPLVWVSASEAVEKLEAFEMKGKAPANIWVELGVLTLPLGVGFGLSSSSESQELNPAGGFAGRKSLHAALCVASTVASDACKNATYIQSQQPT